MRMRGSEACAWRTPTRSPVRTADGARSWGSSGTAQERPSHVSLPPDAQFDRDQRLTTRGGSNREWRARGEMPTAGETDARSRCLQRVAGPARVGAAASLVKSAAPRAPPCVRPSEPSWTSVIPRHPVSELRIEGKVRELARAGRGVAVAGALVANLSFDAQRRWDHLRRPPPSEVAR